MRITSRRLGTAFAACVLGLALLGCTGRATTSGDGAASPIDTSPTTPSQDLQNPETADLSGPLRSVTWAAQIPCVETGPPCSPDIGLLATAQVGPRDVVVTSSTVLLGCGATDDRVPTSVDAMVKFATDSPTAEAHVWLADPNPTSDPNGDQAVQITYGSCG